MKIMYTFFTTLTLTFAPQLLASSKTAELKIATETSTLHWEGRKIVGGAHTGTISIQEGQVAFVDGHPKTAKLIVDMTTIANEDLKDPKWNTKLVDHLKSSDFFDVEKFGTSTLELERIEHVKDDLYQARGHLIIKGIKQEIAFPAQLSKNKNGSYDVIANIEFDRTNFNIKYGSGRFFEGLGDKMISDKVSLSAKIHLSPVGKKTAQR